MTALEILVRYCDALEGGTNARTAEEEAAAGMAVPPWHTLLVEQARRSVSRTRMATRRCSWSDRRGSALSSARARAIIAGLAVRLADASGSKQRPEHPVKSK